jgi:arginase family enzyme
MTPTRLRGVRDAVGRGTTFRSGARFGPEAIRFASGMIRIYNPVQKVQVFGAFAARVRERVGAGPVFCTFGGAVRRQRAVRDVVPAGDDPPPPKVIVFPVG